MRDTNKCVGYIGVDGCRGHTSISQPGQRVKRVKITSVAEAGFWEAVLFGPRLETKRYSTVEVLITSLINL